MSLYLLQVSAGVESCPSAAVYTTHGGKIHPRDLDLGRKDSVDLSKLKEEPFSLQFVYPYTPNPQTPTLRKERERETERERERETETERQRERERGGG